MSASPSKSNLEKINLNKDTIVIYHDNCVDGFTSAWLLHKGFEDFFGRYFDELNNVEYYPASYGNPIPDCKNKNVFIVDFSYKEKEMQEILSSCNYLVLLDHHKTAIEGLGNFVESCKYNNNVHIKLDEKVCGSKLVAEYLKPLDYSSGGDYEDYNSVLVDYVNDRDLWLWKEPYSKAVSASIQQLDFNFKTWDELESRLMFNLEAVINEGKAILKYQNKCVQNAVKNAFKIEILGYKVLATNVSEVSLISSVGEALAQDRPFGVTFFVLPSGEYQFSLRSRGKEGVDVSDISKQFGGGGHKNAAGFRTTFSPKANLRLPSKGEIYG